MELRALLDVLEVASDGFFDVAQDEYDIPASETTYHCLCKTFDELNLEIPQGEVCSYDFFSSYSIVFFLMRIILLLTK